MTELSKPIESTLLMLTALNNLFTFGMFYTDKKRAKKHQRRIPEKTLILSSFCFGGIGAFFGMKIFRHKTKHRLFKICIPFTAFMTAGILLYLIFFI